MGSYDSPVPGVALAVFCAMITQRLFSEWLEASGGDKAILDVFDKFVTECNRKTLRG